MGFRHRVTASHILNTTLCVYDTLRGTYGPHNDVSLSNDVTEMYIRHPPNHFDVVCSVV